MKIDLLAHRLLGREKHTRPVVLVPNQWNGSVQQYYHFLLGYLAPSLKWARNHPDHPIAVRDCGPMNRWFDLLPAGSATEIMTVGDVLHVMAGKLQPFQVLRGMDFPDSFKSAELREFSNYTLNVARERHSIEMHYPPILVTDRASSDDFFSSPGAEWPESGVQKRSVPNLNSIVDSWSRSDVRVIDAAHIDIYEQIQIHAHARVLVGQHGAGLTNMIWMPPGAWVIEILPPMPTDAVNIFRNLAAALELNHLVVHQESVHAPIEHQALLKALEIAAG